MNINGKHFGFCPRNEPWSSCCLVATCSCLSIPGPYYRCRMLVGSQWFSSCSAECTKIWRLSRSHGRQICRFSFFWANLQSWCDRMYCTQVGWVYVCLVLVPPTFFSSSSLLLSCACRSKTYGWSCSSSDAGPRHEDCKSPSREQHLIDTQYPHRRSACFLSISSWSSVLPSFCWFLRRFCSNCNFRGQECLCSFAQ